MSRTLAIAIKRANPEETHSVEVMVYALTIILNILFIIVTSLVIGLATNSFLSTLLALGSLIIIRILSGGPHIRSAWGCNIVSVLICTVVPHVPMIVPLLAINIANVIIMLLFSPQPDKNTNIPRRLFPLLKLLSVSLVSCNFIVKSDVMGLIFFIQAIIMLPWRKEG